MTSSIFLMLAETVEKVKVWFNEKQNDLSIAAIIFLIGMASFGLGKLYFLWPTKTPLVVRNDSGELENPVHAQVTSSAEEVPTNALLPGKFVASKNGTLYHFPWCPGAQKISDKNKIWFQTADEAKNKGYKPAANCPGL